MTAHPYPRADTVCKCSAACCVKLLVNLTQQTACADRGLPGRFIHDELLHVDHIDGNGSVISSEAIVATEGELSNKAQRRWGVMVNEPVRVAP